MSGTPKRESAEDTEDKVELVDILEPPLFKPSGRQKSRGQALEDGDWIGSFNLWVFRNDPVPSILYQQRSLKKSWAPGLLDVLVAGRYRAGETLTDGLREVEEEIGKRYKVSEVFHLGKKIYVGRDSKGRTHNNVVDVFFTEDDSPLESFELQAEEVEAIFPMPVDQLLDIHRENSVAFTAQGLNNDGKNVELTVTKKLFPVNFDNYHFKMAVLADRYFRGETNLVY